MPSKATLHTSTERTSGLFSRRMPLISLGGLFAINAVSVDAPLVIIPTVAEHFAVSAGQAQSVLTLFLLGFALAHIPVGLMGDRFGRRPVILIGMMMTSILALACVMAPSFEALAISRFLQGMTAATGGLLSRAIIRDVVSGAEVSKLTSRVLAMLCVLIIIGPITAAFLLKSIGWRAVLVLVFCYISVIGILTWIYIPETQNSRKKRQSMPKQFRGSLAAYLGSTQSVFASFLGAIVFSTYFIFGTIGASVIVDVFQLPSWYFGPIFAIVAAVQFWVATYNAQRVEAKGVRRMLRFAMLFSVMAVMVVLFSAAMGRMPLGVFVLIAAFFSMSHGMALPNVTALILNPLPDHAGFAASMMGMIQIGFAALIGMSASSLYAGSVANTLMLFGVFGSLNVLMFACFDLYMKNNNIT